MERILHDNVEDSLRQQRRDPLDDFRRCIDAVNNRHAPNVVSKLACFRHGRERAGASSHTAVSQLTASTEVVEESPFRCASPAVGNRLFRA